MELRGVFVHGWFGADFRLTEYVVGHSRYALLVGTKTAISVEEYLHTSFPGIAPEYQDGELVERASPDYPHGRTQALMGACFGSLRRELPVYACLGTWMKIREGLYLIPDVAVFWPSRPSSVPDSPPLIAIEILSPDDRLAAVRDSRNIARGA